MNEGAIVNNHTFPMPFIYQNSLQVSTHKTRENLGFPTVTFRQFSKGHRSLSPRTGYGTAKISRSGLIVFTLYPLEYLQYAAPRTLKN